MKADFAWMWAGGRCAGHVINLQSDQQFARDIGNRRLEVLCDSFRLAMMGGDGASKTRAHNRASFEQQPVMNSEGRVVNVMM
jgi:hypothetical protein